MMIPNFLDKLLIKQYGEELKNKIIDGYNIKRKTTLRVNTLKSNLQEIENNLKQNSIEYERVSWYKDALIIDDKSDIDIQSLNIYQDGKVYLQSLSSMLPPIILNPKEGTDILDMAAAPGGKTTEIAALTNNRANITACEMNKIRAEKLKYNINMQGATRVFVMEKDARQIDDFFSFDQILLDSPCSGSGTLNVDDKNIEKYFTELLIQKSIKSQIALLKKAVKLLKKGSELVYSTCSILKLENEEIVKQVLKEMEIVLIDFEGIENIPKLPTKLEGTLCVMPTDEYEGFFVAKLRKK